MDAHVLAGGCVNVEPVAAARRTRREAFAALLAWVWTLARVNTANSTSRQ